MKEAIKDLVVQEMMIKRYYYLYCYYIFIL